jgi:class 3 adenylate cyclase
MKLAIQHRPDIITSDYDMPVMDGWDFCARLRESEFTSAIPVVMVSSRDTITDKRKAQSLGVAAYLTKPFKTEDLERIVKTMVVQTQRRKKAESLEKYTSNDAVRDIERGGPTPLEAHSVTILSTNIADFGKKFDWLGTDRALEMLNDYFTNFTDIVIERKGVVDSIAGDELLVRFDTGDAKGDAMNAADAVVAMLEYLDDYNARNDDELEVRIGMHSDRILVGNYGSAKNRLVYSMLGDGVGITKQLQRATAPNSCLISADAYAHVQESIGDLPSYSIPRRGGERDIVAYKL